MGYFRLAYDLLLNSGETFKNEKDKPMGRAIVFMFLFAFIGSVIYSIILLAPIGFYLGYDFFLILIIQGFPMLYIRILRL